MLRLVGRFTFVGVACGSCVTEWLRLKESTMIGGGRLLVGESIEEVCGSLQPDDLDDEPQFLLMCGGERATEKDLTLESFAINIVQSADEDGYLIFQLVG
ncbi:hypothetical protein RYX36_010019 [Vicia faba]